MSKRRLAALSASGLVAGTMSVLALAAAPANAATGSVPIDKSFDYTCDVALNYVISGTGPGTGPGSLDLPDQAIGVRAKSSVPATIYGGQTVAPTPASIILTMNSGLQAATVGLGGKTVDGSSDDSTIGFTVAGHTTEVPINNLGVTNSPIPSTGEWTIPTTGTVAAIPVPAQAEGQSATLQMPAQFTAKAKFTVDPSKGLDSMSAVMSCVLPDSADNALLSNSLPIVAPTATSVAVTPASTTFGTAARVSYSVKGAQSGSVRVLEGSKVLANGTFSGGKGSVSLAGLAVGNHALTVQYPGAYGTTASTGRATVTVAKAASSISAAKVTPKKVKAKKTKAKLAVSVASTAGAPTGTVTVTLKGKTVGSATLAGGKAKVKLKKFKKAGKQTLTVSFSGSANINGSAKTVKVKVKK